MRSLLQDEHDKALLRLQKIITDKQAKLIQDIAEQHAALRADFSLLRSDVTTQLENQRLSSDARADELAAQIAALHTASTTSSQLLSVALSPAAADRGQPEPDGGVMAWAHEPHDWNADAEGPGWAANTERWAAAAAADAAAFAAAAAAAAPSAPMLPKEDPRLQPLSAPSDPQLPAAATSQKLLTRKRLMHHIRGHNPSMCMLCHRSFKEIKCVNISMST